MDCTDDDCAAAANCQGPVEDCDVAGDEDGDSLADCRDPECNNQTGPGGGTCQTVETSCADAYDNDGDGASDCADTDCAAECIAAAGSLVITEFIRDPTLASDENGEWFEIKNISAADIDLRGLVIYSAPSQTHVIASADPVTIAAGASMVLARSADAGLNGGLTVGYAFGSAISFNNNSDDSVGLRTAGGTVIDEVLFPIATFANTAGKAMSLDPAHTTAADNNDAANWCVSKLKYNSADYGTPGAANPSCSAETDCANTLDDDGNGKTDCADFACANAVNCSSAAIPTAGSLIVTEIMLNPGLGTPDYQYEWIEIKNVSAQAVELNGLTLCSDTPSVYCSPIHFGVSTPLAAGASALFMSDPALWTAFSGIKYSYGSDIRLDNAAEGVQLYHGATLIDTVAYGVGWPISTVGSAIQFSSDAAQNATANDAPANWCVATSEYDAVNHLDGTPGLANGVCVVATETCDNSADDDGDGLIDCADPDCNGQLGPNIEICQTTEITCDDGFDNDADGLTDCADPNCDGVPGPGPFLLCEAAESTCDDTYDNDSDGQVDCDDPDCAGLPGPGGANCDAPSVEDCTTPEDDDGDTFVNCMDLDCAADAACGWLPQLYLWESDADQASTDTQEFVEVLNLTGSSIDFTVTKYFLLFINGTGEVSYMVVQLTGSLSNKAVKVAGMAGVPNVSDTFSVAYQNGQDGVLLVRCDTCVIADFPNGTLPGTSSTFTVAGGSKTVTKIDGMVYGTTVDPELRAVVGVTEQYSDTTTESLQRISHTTWAPAVPTPGVSNLQ